LLFLFGLDVWFGCIEANPMNNTRNEKVTGFLIYPLLWHFPGTSGRALGWVKRQDAGEFDFEAWRKEVEG
jgi:hypothetical protein